MVDFDPISIYNTHIAGLSYKFELCLGGKKRMKSTGIVRKVDELGRIVLPIELRRTLDIDVKDALEIYVDGDNIVLHKYQPACIFCGNTDGIVDFKGKNVCPECIRKLKDRA
jgi:transcriptional pleiotropic regulator of transition state genes